MRRRDQAVGIVAVVVALIVAGWWFGARPGQQFCCPEPATRHTAAPRQTDAPPRPADAFAVTVTSVSDGDTLRAHIAAPDDVITAAGDVRVRLIGIDTPEVSDPAECGGREATAHLKALAPEGAVLWAAFDADPRDRYERYLLYLWTADGRFINNELVASGDAQTLTVEPNDEYAALFAATEQSARASGAGQWGACG